MTSSKRPSRRRVRYGGQDEQTGVYRPVTWDFIKQVWNYRRTTAPRVRALLVEHA